jgi:hypothetical protein
MSTNLLASIADYEVFIYGLPDTFACIHEFRFSEPAIPDSGD